MSRLPEILDGVSENTLAAEAEDETEGMSSVWLPFHRGHNPENPGVDADASLPDHAFPELFAGLARDRCGF